jgi:hypothetical protein
MAILEYVDRVGELRPARQAGASAGGVGETAAEAVVEVEEEKEYIPLAKKAELAFAKQQAVKAALSSSGGVPEDIIPAFPAPRRTLSKWADFEQIVKAQKEYVGAARVARYESYSRKPAPPTAPPAAPEAAGAGGGGRRRGGSNEKKAEEQQLR